MKMVEIQANVFKYIAGGRPTEDTLSNYNTEIDNFLNWCNGNSYKPLIDIDENKAFDYFTELNSKYSVASVHLKICAARTFYFVASKLNLFDRTNPFAEIKPAKPAYDDTDFEYLDLNELNLICESIIERNDYATKRDLAIIMFMAVEGLRTVEVHRMSDEDINWKRHSILIHGKGRDSYIYPCQDTFDILADYIANRPEPVKDEDGTPTFIGYSKKFYGVRISRNGLRFAVNAILKNVNLKSKGNSCHMLRHSAGTNLYKATNDLRLVQETLRHTDPKTTARYSHLVDRLDNRQTAKISPLKAK